MYKDEQNETIGKSSERKIQMASFDNFTNGLTYRGMVVQLSEEFEKGDC